MQSLISEIETDTEEEDFSLNENNVNNNNFFDCDFGIIIQFGMIIQ